MLGDITKKNIADVIAVLHPLELLANKHKKAFVGKNLCYAIVLLTTPQASHNEEPNKGRFGYCARS